MRFILVILLIFLLSGCADEQPAPLWIRSMETLPKVEGFHRAGVFTINGKVYVQNCDKDGNQIWLRYKEETHTWSQSRYNSQGCARGDNSTGPNGE